MGRHAVDPFPQDDPLCYEELSEEMRALRALLAVLADTGATVLYPPHLAPSSVPLWVAAGWRLQVEVRPARDLPHLEAHEQWARLSARWVARPDPETGYAQCVCAGRAFPHPPGIADCVAAGGAGEGGT